MAHTKAQGAVKGNRDSISKRLGVKIFGGESIAAGNIIVRQKGTKFHSGPNTTLGRDYTITSTANGTVNFKMQRGKKFVEVKTA